jgi:5'-nucleotidase / UDP-sugar diphosphatase
MKRSWTAGLLSLVLFMPGAASAADRERAFTILQMNDVYDIFPVPSPRGDGTREGGLAYISTLVREARVKGPVLLMHSGDFLSPSLLSMKLKHKGAHMIEAMNALGFDLVTFGNHEFDMGCPVLADRIRESKFDWVSSNVDLPPAMGLPPGRVTWTRILTVGGLRVGVFGLTVPQAAVAGCPNGTSITFREPLAAARDAVAALQKDKVDLVVALTHLRIETDQELAAAVPGIDLIVGGHEHEVIVSLVGETLITKAGENATGLGEIGVRAVRSKEGLVVAKSWRRVPVDPASITPDAALDARLDKYRKELEPFDVVVGQAAVPLDIREETVRDAESNLADAAADLMRTKLGADVALLNGGSFRDDRVIPAGPLTRADIYTMLPFANEVVSVRVTGAQLREALENGVRMVGQRAGRFPQVSGLRFRFDPKAPRGERVLSVEVGGAPLEPERTYLLATTDFMVRPGNIDGYVLPQEIVGRTIGVAELLEEALQKGPIGAPADGRITLGARAPAPAR